MPTTVRAYNSDTKTLEDWPWDAELGKSTPLHPVEVVSTYHPFRPNWPADITELHAPPPASPTAAILHEAASLIDGPRHDSHGDRHENFGTIAAYWTVLFGIDIEAWQVARAFELAKIARDVNGSANRDNAVDAAGYSALSWELRNVGC